MKERCNFCKKTLGSCTCEESILGDYHNKPKDRMIHLVNSMIDNFLQVKKPLTTCQLQPTTTLMWYSYRTIR